MRILYDSKNLKFKNPFGTLKQNEACGINIHIPHACKTCQVKLILQAENGEPYAEFYMQKSGGDENYEHYFCEFSVVSAGLYFYYFYIKTQDGEFPLYKEGYDMTNMCSGDLWQLSVIDKDFTVPETYAGAVMYQIFPDRFYKHGETDLNGKLTPYYLHENMADIPHFMPNEHGKVLNNDFYGGNLAGIAEKLDYLKELGVSVIYLNPIFKAYSNHRYDTADYKKIDEMLGTEKDFVSLCTKAHQKGIKIILDGVFSHTGSNSIYFDKDNIFGTGAYSNPDSEYKGWFDFQHYPDKYTSWWGIDTLPCTNELNEQFLNYIIEDEDSVIAHWLNLGADGFRLDVADELPDEFISRLRKRMKGINPDSLLIGEVWEDASNKISYGNRRKYFTHGELDSVMNYPFKEAIINFVLGGDAWSLKNTVMSIYENYPRDVVNTLMNILSTHDTVRILTALGIENVPHEKHQRAEYRLSERELENGINRLKCAVLLQFVLPGMPSIYYGDEIGTQGFEDPFCRSFFDWDRVNDNDFLEFYKKLGKIKNGYTQLKSGDLNVQAVAHGQLVIERKADGKTLICAINVADAPMVLDCGDILLSENADVQGDKIVVDKNGFVLM